MNWESVEKDVTKSPWGLFKWIAIAAVMFVLIFGGINAIVRPASMAVDRAVMKNSFQYKEGMEQRAATLQASIDEIDVRLTSNPENRQDLQNQRSILAAQLRAITINP